MQSEVLEFLHICRKRGRFLYLVYNGSLCTAVSPRNNNDFFSMVNCLHNASLIRQAPIDYQVDYEWLRAFMPTVRFELMYSGI